MIYIVSVITFLAGMLLCFLFNKVKIDRLKELNDNIDDLTLRLEKEKGQNLLLQNKITSCETSISLYTEIQAELKENLKKSEEVNKSLSVQIASLKKENEFLCNDINRLTVEDEEKRKRNETEFRNIANMVLENSSRRFSEQHKDELKTILDPLKSNIEEFKKKVEDTYDIESKQRFSLEEKIKDLVELNSRISEEARNLTNALKGDNKVQGDWGEMILEGILENSGLQKNREYFIQETLKDKEGNTTVSDSGRKMRPDVIVKYPDSRKIIIDSKVSLTAFVRMSESEDETSYNAAVKQHLQSIKAHIDELSKKSYQDYTDNTLDFVMMFIPNESAYLTALQSDQNIWQYGYDKRVVMISPTNLITALKLIADLWKRDRQSRNSIEIAKRGGLLYDKFVILCNKLEDSRSKIISDGDNNQPL